MQAHGCEWATGAFDVVVGCDFCCHYATRLPESAALRAPRASISNKAIRGGVAPLWVCAVQLQRKDPLALTCPALVNGEMLEILVDSAAPWSCADARQRERLRLKTTASPAKITGVGRAGTRGVGVATVKSFRLADVDVKITNLAVFDLADWGFAAPDAALSEVEGILGCDALNAAGA